MIDRSASLKPHLPFRLAVWPSSYHRGPGLRSLQLGSGSTGNGVGKARAALIILHLQGEWQISCNAMLLTPSRNLHLWSSYLKWVQFSATKPSQLQLCYQLGSQFSIGCSKSGTMGKLNVIQYVSHIFK